MKRFFISVFNQIASIKLTIILLFLILFIIGLQLLVTKYQEFLKGWSWINLIASADFFHSRVFLSTLLLFCLNLITCLLKHLKKTLASFNKKAIYNEINRDSFFLTSKVIEGKDPEIIEKLSHAISRHFKKPRIIGKEEGVHFLVAEKGKFASLAFYLAHLALLFLVAGVIISLNGFTYYLDIRKGQVIDPLVVMDNKRKAKKFDFALKCEDFSILNYEDKSVRKHQSTLSILKSGKILKTQVVDFGTPLNYKKIAIYQNHFVSRIPLARIRVITPQGEEMQYEVKNGEVFYLLGNKFPLRAVAFRENSLQLISLSPQDRLWISSVPVGFSSPALSDYRFNLLGYTSYEMTNLKIIYDPGKRIIWYSFLGMAAGFSLMFFFSYSRLSAIVEEQAQGYMVKIGGYSTKDSQMISKIIKAILLEIGEVFK